MAKIDVTPETIKAYREKRNWAQPQMAEALGVSQAQVSRLEKGVATAEGPTLKLLELMFAEDKS